MQRYPIILFVFLLLVAGLVCWYFSEVLSYIVFSILLAVVLNPIVEKLNDIFLFGFQIPRWVGTLVAFFLFIASVYGIVLIFLPLLNRQLELLDSIKIEFLLDHFTIPITKLENYLISHNLIKNKPGFLFNSINIYFLNKFSGGNMEYFLGNVLSFGSNIIIAIFAIPFITFSLLTERGILRNSIFSLIPNKYFEVFISVFTKLEDILAGYLRGIFLQMFIIISLSSILLFFVGIKYSLILGLVLGIFNLIPYLGPIIALSICLVVSFTTATISGNPDYVSVILKLGIVFSVIQLTDMFFIRPYIFSRTLQLHPLEIFILIFIGAEIGGAVGMIAVLPAYTIIKVSLGEFLRAYNQYRVFKFTT